MQTTKRLVLENVSNALQTFKFQRSSRFGQLNESRELKGFFLGLFYEDKSLVTIVRPFC